MTPAVRDPDDRELHASPAARIAGLVRLMGETEVALWSAGLLADRIPFDDPDRPSSTWVGGAHAAQELQRGDVVTRGQAYWFRVWGARALLYTWAPQAASDVVAGLGDDAWRVREMCAKVARVRELGEAAPRLALLLADPVPRVRSAAASGLSVTAEIDEVPALQAVVQDPDRSVRVAAARALEQVARRLDREL